MIIIDALHPNKQEENLKILNMKGGKNGN